MNLALLQQAVKTIEADGTEGFWAAVKLVGMPTALALLIAHLRHGYGSPDTFPADPEIDTRVERHIVRYFPEVAAYFRFDMALFYMGEWYFFDNFSAFNVYYRSYHCPTAEHAYQMMKFLAQHPEIAEIIRSAPSAHDAKLLANTVYRESIRADWGDVKEGFMEDILRAKLSQHPYGQKKLRECGGRLPVEDSPKDDYWGRGRYWNGRNRLGYLWQRLGEELLAGTFQYVEK
jgi:ribA/ribD-fused uncharacterized protein